jgi:IS605 OrfB family transposase
VRKIAESKGYFTKAVSVELVGQSKEDTVWLLDILNRGYPLANKMYLLYRWYYEGLFPTEIELNKLETYVYHKAREDSRFTDIPSNIIACTNRAILQKIKYDIKSGAKSGKKSWSQFKKGQPLYFVQHNYLEKTDDGYNYNFIFGHKFKLKFGRHNEGEQLIEKLMDSESQFKLNANAAFKVIKRRLFLLLSYEIPDKIENKPNPDNIMGIDFGMANFATCYLANDRKFKIVRDHKYLKKRLLLQRKIKNLQSELSMHHAGLGRARKTRKIEDYRNKEKNLTKTEISQILSSIVRLAQANNIGTIKIEYLTIDQKTQLEDKYVYRNWAVMMTIDMLREKAKYVGINVVTIDPYHTSQKCSTCGTIGTRDGRIFSCENPSCKSYHKVVNADKNAAINIANSTQFVDDVKDTEYYKQKQEFFKTLREKKETNIT